MNGLSSIRDWMAFGAMDAEPTLGAPCWFECELVLAETVDLLQRGALTPAWLQLLEDGSVCDISEATDVVTVAGRQIHVVAPDVIERFSRTRKTLAVAGLERLSKIGFELCTEMGRLMGGSFDLNAYLTPPHSQGFDLHYDPQDVYLYQAKGCKIWELFRPDHELPGPGDYMGKRMINYSHVPESVVSLSSGEILYIPRGWGHRGRAVEDASVHLTLGHNVETVATHIFGIPANAAVDVGRARSCLRRNAWTMTRGELDGIRRNEAIARDAVGRVEDR